MIRFASPFPAVTVEDPTGKRHGVVGDLHLGLEAAFLRTSPLFSSFLSQGLIEEVRAFAETYSLESLIILGDVKHSIIRPPLEEKNLVNTLFDVFRALDLEVQLVRGNHDPGIQNFIRGLPNVHLSQRPWIELSTSEGGSILIVHGHRRLPPSTPLPLTHIVMGHLHPCVRVTLRSGRPSILRVFLESDALRRGVESDHSTRIIVLPSFNSLGCYLFSRSDLRKRLAVLRDFDLFEDNTRVFDLANNFLGDLAFLFGDDSETSQNVHRY